MTLSLPKLYLVTSVLIFFLAGLGYTPYVPYWTHNFIFFALLPPIFFFGWKTDRIFVILCIAWLVVGLAPFFYSTITLNELWLRGLKIMAPVFAYMVGKNSGIDYRMLVRLCIWGLYLNAGMALVELFILPHAYMVDQGAGAHWVKMDLDIPLWAYRVTGFLGNPNALGAYAAFTMAFVLGSKSLRNKWLYLVFSLIVAFACAKSRNSAMVILGMIMLSPIFNDRYRHSILCLTLLGMLALVLVTVDMSVLRLYFFRSAVFGDNVDTRMTVNLDGIRIWWKNMITLGGGMGSETYYMIAGNAARPYTESAYIKLLLERGLLGFFMHCGVLAYVYFKARGRQLRDTMKYICIAIGGISFFETVFYVKELYIILFFCFGCIVGMSGKEDPTQSEVESNPGEHSSRLRGAV